MATRPVLGCRRGSTARTRKLVGFGVSQEEMSPALKKEVVRRVVGLRVTIRVQVTWV